MSSGQPMVPLSSDGSSRSTPRGLHLALLLTLVAITLVVYLPAIRGGFVWDDDDYVLNNTALRTPAGLWTIWFETDPAKRFYPLSQYYAMVYTVFWLEYHLWGTDPLGYHGVNVLLHALNAVLLALILRRLAVPGGWLAAAVFALHPVHVESVAWITELKNVLSGAFFLGALLAYLRFEPMAPVASPAGRNRRFYGLAIALFACALVSKSVTCSLPAVILLVLWWKRDKIRWGDVLPLIPFFAVGLVLGLLTVWMEKQYVGASGPEWDLTFTQRLLIASRALWFYAGKLVWPTNLTFIYPRWEIDASHGFNYLFVVLTLAAVIGLWLLRRRLGKGPLVAVLFFAGVLFPALGFVNIYPMRYSFVADHFQYLASIGLIVVIVAATAKLIARASPRAAYGAAAASCALVVLGSLTWRQGYVYTDLETLWRDTLRKNPDAWIAHNNYGNLLTRRGQYKEALEHLNETLRIKPGYPQGYNNRANAYIGLGEIGRAHV